MIKFEQYEVITFDCYGTLIDWETGMLNALQSLLANHSIQLDNDQILALFAEFEAEQEKGEYRPYRQVLRNVVGAFGQRLGFEPSPDEQDALPDSIQHWQPFDDTIAALKSLSQRFKLAIISNIDDSLFAATAARLEVKFDHVITAEQARSYKPSLNNFRLAIDRIGVPAETILHAACSLYHDVLPASSLGLATVWVNRRTGKTGSGAALPAIAQADLEVPDLQTLAALSSQEK